MKLCVVSFTVLAKILLKCILDTDTRYTTENVSRYRYNFYSASA